MIKLLYNTRERGVKMTVGEKIKKVRIAKNMSQEELALKMGYKDRSSISKIEKSADEKIPMNIVQKAAEVLKCSPLYLMGWSDYADGTSERDYEQVAMYADLFKQLKDSDKEIVNNLIKSLASKG